jgi:hypothetical protein
MMISFGNDAVHDRGRLESGGIFLNRLVRYAIPAPLKAPDQIRIFDGPMARWPDGPMAR